jgi:hypothetical protein
MSHRLSAAQHAAVDCILSGFDFQQVQRFMEMVDWRWGNAVPSCRQLKSAAQQLLYDLASDEGAISLEMGGLRADHFAVSGGVREFRLVFEAQSFASEYTPLRSAGSGLTLNCD